MPRRSRARDRAIRARRLRNWWTRDALIVALPLIALIALTFWIAFQYVKPAPPNHLVMATGAPGGVYEKYGDRYRERLAKYGVTLELVPTRGAAENFALLRDGRVDVAFVQGGLGVPLPEVDNAPPVVSLGALYYEPLWIFLSADRPQVDRLAELAGARMAVGPDGSGTRALALKLLSEGGAVEGGTRFLPIAGEEALTALEAHEVEVIFQVAGVEAPVVAALLRRRDLRQMSLAHAVAFAKRNAYLSVLTVPRGVVSIAEDLPSRDVTMVATTANLLAQSEVHPALMYLLLDTASEINSTQTHLAEARTFPNARGQDMPVAPEAARYYKSGKPFLHNYLPYWAANLVDRTLILLIPVFGVLLPAFKIAPWLYTYRLKSRIFQWYEQLTQVEIEISREGDRPLAAPYLARLDAIEAEIKSARLPSWLREQAYLLRSAIVMVRERLLETGKAPPDDTPTAAAPTGKAKATELGTPS
jgi:TRAP transporter TAXI family solute receptor